MTLAEQRAGIQTVLEPAGIEARIGAQAIRGLEVHDQKRHRTVGVGLQDETAVKFQGRAEQRRQHDRLAEQPADRGRIIVPGQEIVEPGTEPLLYAATSPGALSGAYYCPGRLFGLVGPTTLVRVPRSARHDDDGARLWHVAEELTGVALADA